MQKCKPACGLCKGANVKDIFRSQVQVRVPGEIHILNLYLNPNTRARLPTAETRDPKSFPSPSPSSGSSPKNTFALPLVRPSGQPAH